MQALSHYQKAYSYRPENPFYGQAYADSLYQQNNFKEAGPVYEGVIKIWRSGATPDPHAKLLFLATTLNNLGNLYTDTKRFKEAEGAYIEALARLIHEGAMSGGGRGEIGPKMLVAG